jgi:hypothetical protein
MEEWDEKKAAKTIGPLALKADGDGTDSFYFTRSGKLFKKHKNISLIMNKIKQNAFAGICFF